MQVEEFVTICSKTGLKHPWAQMSDVLDSVVHASTLGPATKGAKSIMMSEMVPPCTTFPPNRHLALYRAKGEKQAVLAQTMPLRSDLLRDAVHVRRDSFGYLGERYNK